MRAHSSSQRSQSERPDGAAGPPCRRPPAASELGSGGIAHDRLLRSGAHRHLLARPAPGGRALVARAAAVVGAIVAVDRPVERARAADREVQVAGRSGAGRRDRHAGLGIDRDGRSAVPGAAGPPPLLLATRRPVAEPAHARRRVAGPPSSSRGAGPDLTPEPGVGHVPAEAPAAERPPSGVGHAPLAALVRGRGPSSGRAASVPSTGLGGGSARTCPPRGVVELAHRVGQAARRGERRAPRDAVSARSPVRRVAPSAPPRPGEELREPALGLEVPPDHHRVVRLERLRHPVDQRPREPQRVAHLAHRRPRPVRDEVADHPRVLGPVALVDVLDDLLPPLGGEVDVDVRVRRPALVDEPLEQQLVADRVDARDPQHVGDDRVRRAPPPLRRDVLRLREPHQVPADQEELGEARSSR